MPPSTTFQPRDFLRYFVSPAAFGMLVLIIVQEAAKAAFKDGILEVTLPKTASATRTNVPIE
ncbi:MAG: hypothetical protein AW09_004545 [Candidatus Accumulibacter phosphatis]|uniref:SHSP domain-containing protein n=1 Tax=Candidatus Accumulibacter phosphatis TaxID=327160 RepID=A0A084Y6M6_9PROT|nr:MAG: hypothetical protein AW09_004545 [Candidatus Accumulibacter phosphatis]HCZ15732.1 Hsp20/alpha crystallin family protein [Accumulibacter sp.]